MKQRMYQPEELIPYKEKFKFCFDGEYTYVINFLSNTVTKVKLDEPVILSLNSSNLNICKEAVILWREGLYQIADLIDVHNAVMKAHLNQELKIDETTVRKYL